MRIKFLAGVAVAVMMLQGCASTAELEQRQLAYTGTGSNPCLFGGVTEAANLHCQQVRWGSEGVLMAINAQATRGLSRDDADHPCQEHVKRVETALADHPGYRSQRVYSCPAGGSDNCHVSLLVSAPDHKMYVVDNGAVLKDDRYRGNVAALQEYAAELDQVYWVGSMPANAKQIANARYSGL
ncbi:MAG TPA: hypothetical protein VHE37_01840 [Nevskiaceae bacterium]|nr:hypothetical protein [Nevskiaceae bacterium]